MPPTPFELREKAGWSYYALPEFEATGIVHGFFTGRTPSHRMEGRERQDFLDAFRLKDTAIMLQEHGDTVHVVEGGRRPSSGDGIILLEKGVAGIIKTADCLPVILADPGFPMAAIVHAGWRGTAKRIVASAIRRMADLGAKREDMAALMGPAIGPCCYEIQEDVRDVFVKEGFSGGVIRRREGGGLSLDLKAANRETLLGEGVERIHDAALCTYCSGGLFHSFRKGEKDRRQINFVSLR